MPSFALPSTIDRAQAVGPRNLIVSVMDPSRRGRILMDCRRSRVKKYFSSRGPWSSNSVRFGLGHSRRGNVVSVGSKIVLIDEVMFHESSRLTGSDTLFTCEF